VKKQAKFGVGISVIVASLGFLAWLGYGESKTYYHTIAELETLNGSARCQRMRVGGTVAVGSIRHLAGRVILCWRGRGRRSPLATLARTRCRIRFVDKSQALVEGHTGPEGRFVAEVVQAKCASKYEAAPGGKGGAAPSATDPRVCRAANVGDPESPGDRRSCRGCIRFLCTRLSVHLRAYAFGGALRRSLRAIRC